MQYNQNEDDSMSEEKPAGNHYEDVMQSIKNYKQNREDRENHLGDIEHLNDAIKNAGYDAVRNHIANVVGSF